MAAVFLSGAKKFSRYEKPVRNLFRRLFRYYKNPEWSLDVYFVDDVVMPKNVLAYPSSPHFPHPDRPGKFLGEVYVNPEYIARHGESLPYLLIHGFLHLLGYDHKRNNDRILMERKEQELLEASKFLGF
jgi:rRNA maturation RNase YbeY